METFIMVAFGTVLVLIAAAWIVVEVHIRQIEKEIVGERALSEPDPEHNFIASSVYTWRCTNCNASMIPVIGVNTNAPYQLCDA